MAAKSIAILPRWQDVYMSITGIEVNLIGNDGNAFSILGQVSRAMRAAMVEKDVIDAFMDEAMNGDYNHLLRTCMEYVEVV